MYPIIAILLVGIFLRDKNMWAYVLPLSILGMVIAFYHNLLYYGIIPKAIAPCTFGVSCTTKQLTIFGFIGIPMLSLIAFTVITVCMVIFRKTTQVKKDS